MSPGGVPDGLDADTSRRIVRSFLVVRIVRGGLFLFFLAVAALGVQLRGWPLGLTIAIALAMLVQAGALAVWWHRYQSLRSSSTTPGSP